jgi:hypothetical protein
LGSEKRTKKADSPMRRPRLYWLASGFWVVDWLEDPVLEAVLVTAPHIW